MFKFIFYKTDVQNARFLGKTVARFMEEGLSAPIEGLTCEPTPFKWRGEDAVASIESANLEETACAPQGATPNTAYDRRGDVTIRLPLDMPLVTGEDVAALVFRMRQKRIPSLSLGRGGAKIEIAGGDSGIFVDGDAFLNICDAKSFCMVYNLMRKRIVDSLVARGVVVLGEDSVYIDATADIESGAIIKPFSVVEGDSKVERGATICASRLVDSVVESGATVEASHLASSRVRAGASVGPYARLRGADVGEGCRIGDFVEVKASKLGGGVKAAHLAYIGDASVGEGTNIGCGSVFCNFDGKSKHRTRVGKNCFIGANANLVAPISVGDGAFIAAGTTLTEDVADNTFTVGRVRQNTKNKK